jgi:transposase
MNGRRKWTAAEKLRIVLAGLEKNIEIADLCRREGISATQFYGWKKQLLGAATTIFDEKKGKPSHKQKRLERENERFKGVIAEITAENLDLKKTLSD